MNYTRQTLVTIQRGNGSIEHLFGAEADLYNDIAEARKELARGTGMKARKKRQSARLSYKWNLNKAIRSAIKE